MDFLESIRFEDGHYHLLSLHQLRVNRTFAAFYPGIRPLQLEEVLPSIDEQGKSKVRVVYNHNEHQIEHAPYHPKVIRSVKLVEADALEYAFKYSDRKEINKLVEDSGADEIIIVRNGFITDASYANLAFWDGKIWWTPSEPLLSGVRRKALLDQKKLIVADIRVSDIRNFKSASLINAMLDLDEMPINTTFLA